MKKTTPPNPQSFLQDYQTLEEVVAKLRTATAADVDHLLELVEKANLAYKNCQARLDSVKALLDAKGIKPSVDGTAEE